MPLPLHEKSRRIGTVLALIGAAITIPFSAMFGFTGIPSHFFFSVFMPEYLVDGQIVINDYQQFYEHLLFLKTLALWPLSLCVIGLVMIGLGRAYSDEIRT